MEGKHRHTWGHVRVRVSHDFVQEDSQHLCSVQVERQQACDCHFEVGSGPPGKSVLSSKNDPFTRGGEGII